MVGGGRSANGSEPVAETAIDAPAAEEPPPSLSAGEGDNAGDAVNPPGESVEATADAADEAENATEGADAVAAAGSAEVAAQDAEPDVEAAKEVRTAVGLHTIAFVVRAQRSPPPAPSLTPLCFGRRSPSAAAFDSHDVDVPSMLLGLFAPIRGTCGACFVDSC